MNNQKNNKKAQPLSEIFNSSIEIQILDSIMPGGEYWELFSDSGCDCKKDCTSYCQSGKGPYNKLCTTNWHSAKLNIRTLSVLKHVFTYFEYYNRAGMKTILNYVATYEQNTCHFCDHHVG